MCILLVSVASGINWDIDGRRHAQIHAYDNPPPPKKKQKQKNSTPSDGVGAPC